MISKQNLKIALLTDGIWPYIIGGMQKHSYLLCKYLAREKVFVVLFHPQTECYTAQKQTELFTDKELQYIEWVEVPKPKTYSFPGHYLYESYLYSKNCFTILENRNDIGFIYAKGLTAWYSLKRKKSLPCEIGINVHGYEFLQIQANAKEKWNARLLERIFRYLHKKADCVFSYGGDITQYIRKLDVPPEKIIEIPGAVEPEWLRTNQKGKTGCIKKFFFMGRFERRKGIEEINLALTELGENGGFEFHFIGPIPVQKQISLPHVKYHGLFTSKDEIINLMDQMDVLVCPSYSEGMPNVIMEAMSRGCAIIATNVGAVPLLVDKENGWLIHPASVEELKKMILAAALTDYKHIELMGEASLNRIRNKYTWPIIVDLFKRRLSAKIKPDE
jgi:glycosyltransferase involved in cell wall biosynthesis